MIYPGFTGFTGFIGFIGVTGFRFYRFNNLLTLLLHVTLPLPFLPTIYKLQIILDLGIINSKHRWKYALVLVVTVNKSVVIPT